MNSGNVYRFRPDGSHLEQITHGQVNPFGLCFDPLGYLYSCDCHSQPIYQLMRGGYYPSFGKPHDGLGFAPEMYSNYQDSTAIAGIAYYAADHFPEGIPRQLLHRRRGDQSRQRVSHQVDRLQSARRVEILPQERRSVVPPVDIKLGPDGALYIADFYNRIIGHYEVDLHHPGPRSHQRPHLAHRLQGPGRQESAQGAAQDWTTASVDELVKDLAHPNLTVRMKAMNRTRRARRRRVPTAVQKLLDKDATVWQRVHGLWVLERTGKLDEHMLADAAKHPEMPVRVHAQRSSDSGRSGATRNTNWCCTASRTKARMSSAPPPMRWRCIPRRKTSGRCWTCDEATKAEDTHLIQAVRIALRDQLLLPANVDETAEWPERRDAKNLADVSLACRAPKRRRFC